MLKLILADNQAIFRAGIAKVLAVEDEMRIVAQAQTPEQMFMSSCWPTLAKARRNTCPTARTESFTAT
jgi:DNA-binding NarL/FixJ family response regulator